ncbi:MAG: hypothetical protein ACO3YO_00380 [Chthoniobacterales bacterium]|jgi:hypothetical protein
MIRAAVLVVSAYLAVIVPEFIPAMPFFANAHILLMPVVVCYALLWMPVPGALAFALYAGLLGDLALLHVDGGRVEIGLGWSMLYYVLLAAVLRMLPVLRLAMRWETHCLASGAATFVLLAGQYLMVCLRRESFVLDGAVFAQLIGPAMAALLLAPLLYFFFGLFPADGFRRRGRRVKQ